MILPKTTKLVDYCHLPIQVLPARFSIRIFFLIEILQEFVIIRELPGMLLGSLNHKKLN